MKDEFDDLYSARQANSTDRVRLKDEMEIDKRERE